MASARDGGPAGVILDMLAGVSLTSEAKDAGAPLSGAAPATNARP